MGEFDLDLQTAESQIADEEDGGPAGRVVLDILDGTTPDEEWTELVEDGNILVLKVDGDVNERAAGFAREVRDQGGQLMHFRGFLIIAPPGVSIDTDRLE